MPSVYKRKSRTGKGWTWRAVVRAPGNQRITRSFPRKELADDWARETEYKIKHGNFDYQRHNNNYTFQDLADRYIDDGVIEHYQEKRDVIRHLKYFCGRFGAYPLSSLNREFLSQERKLLAGTPTKKGKLRENATINRYISSLSAIFTYAHVNLEWISENPCKRLKKFKEAGGRNRILTQAEVQRLLEEARSSTSPYIYCITLLT